MSIRIKTLCENTATFGYLGEWGFSMLVEFNNQKFLLDTGMSHVALTNAQKLHLDFSDLDAIVLSHGHLDHTGGLLDIVKKAAPIKIVAHPQIWGEKLSERRTPPDENIGIPFDRATLENAGGSFTFCQGPLEFLPDVFTTGEVPMHSPFESIDKGLLLKTDLGIVDDPLVDDISVGIKTDRGLFVLFGCAHRGPVNIISHLLNITGESRVYGVVGGLHLSRATDERIAKTIRFFKEVGVQKVACSHCTGFKASAALAREFGDGFILNNSGTRLFFN